MENDDRIETRVLPEGDPLVTVLDQAGWALVARSWAAQLDADRVDRSRLAQLIARTAPHALVREVGAADLGSVRELDAATVGDYPGSVATEHTLLTDETAQLSSERRAFGAWTPAGKLIAVTYVDRNGPDVETHFTVVAPEWRGRGVGSAVKAASVLELLDDGVLRFRTGGSSENVGSIAANERIGYVLDEAWVTMTGDAAAL